MESWQYRTQVPGTSYVQRRGKGNLRSEGEYLRSTA